MRNLIVGIDPGKTSAIACIDLEGNIVVLNTERFARTEWFIDNIKKSGSPVVIASDKKHANHTVAKLATIFNAVLFTPNSDMRVSKKNLLLSNKKVSNLHERDALTAAFNAYYHYLNKLNQVDHIARTKNNVNIDEIKAKVIKKYSVHEAIIGKENGRFIK